MCSYFIHRIETFSRKPYLTIGTYIWLIAAAVADVIIAASLAYSLVRIQINNSISLCLLTPEHESSGKRRLDWRLPTLFSIKSFFVGFQRPLISWSDSLTGVSSPCENGHQVVRSKCNLRNHLPDADHYCRSIIAILNVVTFGALPVSLSLPRQLLSRILLMSIPVRYLMPRMIFTLHINMYRASDPPVATFSSTSYWGWCTASFFLPHSTCVACLVEFDWIPIRSYVGFEWCRLAWYGPITSNLLDTIWV